MILRMNGAPVLDAEHAAFVLRPGISITAASRTAANLPQLGRALGCRIAPDRGRVTILLPADQYAPLAEALRESRAVAVVFSEPTTHRTIQLKGTDAEIEPIVARDAELVARWTEDFVAGLEALGFNAPMVRSFLWCDPAGLVAVGFTPQAAFEQTPGPQAGMPLQR